MANKTSNVLSFAERDIDPVARAAMAIAQIHSTDLILIICKDRAICIPGRDRDLGTLASQMRTLADGLDKANQEVQGLTVDQLFSMKAQRRTDA